MRKVYCPNHHFYDGDKYASCPICEKEGLSGMSVPKPDPKTEPISGSWKDKIRGIKRKDDNKGLTGEKEPITGEEPSSKTVQPVSGTPEFQPVDMISQQPSGSPGLRPSGGASQPPVDVMSQQPPVSGIVQPSPAGGASRQGVGNSLQKDLGSVNKGNEPKTMSYWGNHFTDEPPVGWFACIGGPCVGMTYEIYSGKNGIGRKVIQENKIAIQQDGKISGTKHTTVMYDPKGRKFYLLPGEGNGMVYRNDEIVLNTMELQTRDVLQIGDTSLMLVPLCGPEFTWEDWMEKGEE